MTSADAKVPPPDEDGGLRRWWWVDFAVPLALLVLGTALFWSGELDLELQMPHYSETEGWRDEAQPWKALYDVGVIPPALVTFACILILPLSYRLRRVRALRAPAIFFLAVMAVGPGLVANAMLKDHWNRPRPRSVEQFGGRYAFEPVLRIDRSSRGKSFPCGHATSVFALASLWLLLRERRKTRLYGWLVLMLGTTLGAMTCYARMVQGGHFASDGLWAWGILALTSSSIYWILRKKVRNRPLTMEPGSGTEQLSRLPLRIKLITGFLVLAFFGTFLLAIPYSVAFDYGPLEEATSRPLPLRFKLRLPVGRVEVRSGDTVRWLSSASGFGYSGSRLDEDRVESMEVEETGEEVRNLGHLQRVSGFFSEITQSGELTVPMELLRKLTIELKKGDVTLYLPGGEEMGERSEWRFQGSPSEVVLVLPAEGRTVPDFEIRGLDSAPLGSEGLMRDYAPGIWRAGGIPVLVIKNETEGSVFRVERAESGREELPRAGEKADGGAEEPGVEDR